MQRSITMKKGCVILADSHQNVLEGIRGLLETLFETVIMVADRDSLCRAAKSLNPEMAVIDLSLFGPCHEEYSSEIKSHCPHIKLIMISIYDGKELVQDVLDGGASAFVLKRAVATDLIPAVEMVGRGNLFVSPLCR
jgi:DNA-binding NarL/FixJ family response regulator